MVRTLRQGQSKEPPHAGNKVGVKDLMRYQQCQRATAFLGMKATKSQAPFWAVTDHETKAMFAHVCDC